MCEQEFEKDLEKILEDLDAIDDQLVDIMSEQKTLTAASSIVSPFARSKRNARTSDSREISDFKSMDIAGDHEADDSDEEIPKDMNNKRLASQVVLMDKALESRDELVGLVSRVAHKESEKKSGADELWKKRNQRMFGQMINTLKDFKEKAEGFEDPGAKRCREVEKKHEDHILEERKRLTKQRMELLEQKREILKKHRIVEGKLYVMKQKEEWVKNEKCLMKFIRTKAQPNIFWLPKSLNSRTRSRLARSMENVKIGVKRRVELLDADYEAILKEDDDEEVGSNEANSPNSIDNCNSAKDN